MKRETKDAVSILFSVPEELQSQYTFIAGQYINLKLTLDNQEIRRAYSICSAPHSGELRIAVKAVSNGLFSQFANTKLKAGDGGHKGATFLAQGTIYPDVIESGGAKSKKAVTIKSHHNVGGLPEQLGLKLLEPLRELFKDEVRELGVALGLPRQMVYRHPFPGPGLGVRILGEVKKEYADLLRRADAIFIEELHNFTDESGKSWYDLTSQAFTVFLPVKSVGVMGDGRTYDYVVALRAVQTSDFMTADWAELPYALLKKVSGRIINEVRGINRVTYDVSSKPPATIEWE